ncbi:LysR family transcriptional regulator [Algicola sagamiensis]|uniref:LysR family transcriptional regulator n=1 Tax=Algicola sagamiensis TaxID=163869 RepID=UPI0004781DF3|nr:LysR family transcriptional regulator [Algicola sagamiensis]
MKILMLIEAFATVVECGSFTTAAERLNLSKSFVSKQVTQLEGELGVKLLYRTTRKLSLTEEGQQYYEHCRSIIGEAEKATSEILDSHTNPKGKIRLTVPQSLLISGLGHLLLNFQKQYPEIELDIKSSGKIEDLYDQNIDLALRVGKLEDSNLKSHTLSTSTFVLVASPEYIQVNGEPTEPKELIHHNCIIYGESRLGQNWPFYLKNGEKVVVKVNGNLTSNDGHIILESALSGHGICYGPDYFYAPYIKQGKLKVMLVDFQEPTTITALYPFNKTPTRRLRLLLDHMVESFNGKMIESNFSEV